MPLSPLVAPVAAFLHAPRVFARFLLVGRLVGRLWRSAAVGSWDKKKPAVKGGAFLAFRNFFRKRIFYAGRRLARGNFCVKSKPLRLAINSA